MDEIINELKELNRKARIIYQNAKDSDDWDMACGLMFNKYMSGRVYAYLKELNISMDYYNSTASSQENAAAFMLFFNDVMDRLPKF